MSCGNCQKNNQPMTIGKAIHGAIGLSKAALGIGTTNNGTIDARRNICRHCEHSSEAPINILKLTSICKICNCIIMAKTKLTDEHCPLSPPKW